MAQKNLYDEARVRALPDGGELVLGPNDLATPAALDAAFAKRIRVVRASAGARGTAAAIPAAAGGLWARILAQDGTYVIEVKGGRARAARLTESGPVPVKEA